jgi:hypothetical protein
MDLEQQAQEMREKAARYRALARQLTDGEEAGRIFEFAEELEQQARKVKPGK